MPLRPTNDWPNPVNQLRGLALLAKYSPRPSKALRFLCGRWPAENTTATTFGKRGRAVLERITAGGGRSAECRACSSGGEGCWDGDPESSRRPLAHPPLH